MFSFFVKDCLCVFLKNDVIAERCFYKILVNLRAFVVRSGSNSFLYNLDKVEYGPFYFSGMEEFREFVIVPTVESERLPFGI